MQKNLHAKRKKNQKNGVCISYKCNISWFALKCNSEPVSELRKQAYLSVILVFYCEDFFNIHWGKYLELGKYCTSVLIYQLAKSISIFSMPQSKSCSALLLFHILKDPDTKDCLKELMLQPRFGGIYGKKQKSSWLIHCDFSCSVGDLILKVIP